MKERPIQQKTAPQNPNKSGHLFQDKTENRSFFQGERAEGSFFSPAAEPTPVQRKKNENLPEDLQTNMEHSLGHDFSNVNIQKNSQEAADMHARAFTKGDSVHFAPGEFDPHSEQGKNLIGHEFTHVAQQRSGAVQPTRIMGKGLQLNDNQGLEHEADHFGRKAAKGDPVSKYRSSGLGMRNSMRVAQAKSDVVQRDIKGKSTGLTKGEWDLNFTKMDAMKAGAQASEMGTIKFTPNSTAPNSNPIRLIQIVKTVDVGGATASKPGDAMDWSKVGDGKEADRNKVLTESDPNKGVQAGFFIDHSAASANPRTKKADATVSPYYRDYWPNAGVSQDGYKKSSTDIQPASLADAPGFNVPTKFNFVTSAKGSTTGTWYGSALWGFEVYNDKGIAKIKGEYKSFRENRGATTDAAIEKFNDFYKNPGTSGAPTK